MTISGPQRITVKCSEVSYPPLLAKFSICYGQKVLKIEFQIKVFTRERFLSLKIVLKWKIFVATLVMAVFKTSIDQISLVFNEQLH